MMQAIKDFFGINSSTSGMTASDFLVGGGKKEKQELFERALEKSTDDQKQILERYEKKYPSKSS